MWKFFDPTCTTIQGHPRSEILVPGKCPWMVCYPTSIQFNVISITIFDTFDVKALFNGVIVNISSISIWQTLVVRTSTKKAISNHISWDSTLMASLVKIGGGLRPVERSTRLCDRLTDWLTHRQSDFVICLVRLMHWTDNERYVVF